MAVTRARLPLPPSLQARDAMRRTKLGTPVALQPRNNEGRAQLRSGRVTVQQGFTNE